MKTRKKGQRSHFTILVVFEKLTHNNLIREIDESCRPILLFSRFGPDFIDLPREHRQGRPDCLRYDIFEGADRQSSVRGGNPKAPPWRAHSVL